jgi:ABC-type branched-subunit amino acid transport system substrate-binding protein
MRLRRLAIVIVVPLLACPPDRASGQPAANPAMPPGPVLRLGALLPLSGPGVWFGTEIKRGLDLAVAELKPVTKEPPSSPDAASSTQAGTQAGTPPTGSPSTASPAPRAAPPTAPPADPAREDTEPSTSADSGAAGAESTTSDGAKPTAPPTEPVEALDRPRTVTLVVQALDVQPLDVRAAGAETGRLLASGVMAIVTASPTPTLTAYPLVTARDVLLLYAGLPTDRFPAASRTLLHLRPPVAARAEVLAAHAWALGIRRLALLAGGDDFGGAVRAGTAARWRKQGGSLVRDESLSLDAAELRSRLRPVARSAPEAVVLGYQGAALGEAARALRSAGYAGRLLAVDDDRAALLAGGPALDGALILADAFVPVAGTRGARFARAYEARHFQPPSRFAASAYETAVLLADAVPRALRGGAISGSRLRAALVGRRAPSLYAGDVMVRDDGMLARPLALFRVEGNKLSFDSYVDVEGRAVAIPQGSESPPPPIGLLPR